MDQSSLRLLVRTAVIESELGPMIPELAAVDSRGCEAMEPVAETFFSRKQAQGRGQELNALPTPGGVARRLSTEEFGCLLVVILGAPRSS